MSNNVYVNLYHSLVICCEYTEGMQPFRTAFRNHMRLFNFIDTRHNGKKDDQARQDTFEFWTLLWGRAPSLGEWCMFSGGTEQPDSLVAWSQWLLQRRDLPVAKWTGSYILLFAVKRSQEKYHQKTQRVNTQKKNLVTYLHKKVFTHHE